MSLADKQMARVAGFVQSSLAPGEQVMAVLPLAMKGPSLWLVALVSSLLVFLQTPYAVVVTNRRLLLVRLRRAMTSYPPRAIEGEYPLGSVGVRVARGPVTSRFWLDRPGMDSLSLSVGRVYRDGADQVAVALKPLEAPVEAPAAVSPA